MKLPSFSKRPAYSLLYITDTVCYRLDVDKAGVVIGSINSSKVNCPTSVKLADGIKQIVDNSTPLGKKTWILYDRLVINLLSIPTMQIEGVDEKTLLQALQFELEGLTGQSYVDTQLAYTLLSSSNEMSSFWISQIGTLAFEDIQKALQKAGSQLVGLLHPAGLNVFVENPEQTDWLRFECWAQQLVALRNTEENGLTVELLSFESRQWSARLDKWLAVQTVTEHSETLLTDVLQMLPDTHFQLFLKDDESITRWLSLWASALTAKTLPSVPVLQYRSAVNQDLLLMAGGGGVAVLLCVLHLAWNLYQTNDYNNKVTELKQVETSLTALSKGVTDDNDKKAKLTEKISKLKTEAEALPSLISGLQHRPTLLLASIAKGRPNNLLLEEIAVDKNVIRLKGISLDSTSANELVGFLEKQLFTLGWSIGAPSKTNMATFADGGPWEFEITLTDLGLDGFKKKP